MNIRNCMILGLALVLAFTLAMSLPFDSQAQQNLPAPSGQNYASSYDYNNNYVGTYCPMGPGYGSSAPVKRDYHNNGSRTWSQSYQGAWCPWNSGYARGSRGGWGCR